MSSKIIQITSERYSEPPNLLKTTAYAAVLPSERHFWPQSRVTVIKKDQGLCCLLGNILNVRNELFQLPLTVKIVIPHLNRNIEPIWIPAMKPKIANFGSSPREVRHQFGQFGFVDNAKSNSVSLQELKSLFFHPRLISEFKDQRDVSHLLFEPLEIVKFSRLGKNP